MKPTHAEVTGSQRRTRGVVDTKERRYPKSEPVEMEIWITKGIEESLPA